jgi:hypothetical protein
MATHALRELPTIMVIDPDGNLVSRVKDSAKLKSLIESTANRASAK